MRIIVTGDRNWYAPDLAEQVLNRLLLRYGPGLVIVHGGATGIDRSFAEACGELGVEQEAHPAGWDDLDHPEAVIRYDKRNRPLQRQRRAGQERGDSRGRGGDVPRLPPGDIVEQGNEGLCLAVNRGGDTDVADRLGGCRAEAVAGG